MALKSGHFYLAQMRTFLFGVDRDDHRIDGFALAPVRRYGIAVGELPETGRQLAAILNTDMPFLVDSRDRDDLSVRCMKSRFMPIGGNEQFIAYGNLDCASFIYVEGLRLRGRKYPLSAEPVASDNALRI